ncbi:MAG: GNAT family N-acetyltransferase [Dethiosulfatibacter sp.]|nr:GNAT family N-acetyltransferase [Dethiosulfatibacter sp.]
MNVLENVPTLVSSKVLLREINVPVDAPEWYKHMKDPEIHQWMGNDVPTNVNETRSNLQKYKEIPHIISWAVINNETGKIIGIYWIWKPIENEDGVLIIPSEVERISKQYWRKGFTKEARKLVYQYCFNTLKANEIHAQAWKDNVNSIKSLEHAGHSCYKEEIKMVERYKSLHVECHFKLTKEGWLNSKLMNSK